jgi:hypothetical protein
LNDLVLAGDEVREEGGGEGLELLKWVKRVSTGSRYPGRMESGWDTRW